ncbi:MAG: DUF4143 domain-containing protein [Actinomycetota bacterium]|nr:DUF4143 domain-containing protein [Actinomycetota bacterium]
MAGHPRTLDLVRRSVDSTIEPGQFILTGSAIPADDSTRHTGAGRFIRLRQRTMTCSEKLDGAKDQVSIAGLFEGIRPSAYANTEIELEHVVDHILRPGFPAMTALSPEQSADRLRAYIDDGARTHIRRLADVRHKPDVIRQLIAAISRSVATEVNYTTLANDVRVVAPNIDVETISSCVELLQRQFIVESQQTWAPKLRSRARLQVSPKLHLVDASLAAAALGAGPVHLRNDLETLGILFESAVIHDLMVFVSAMGGEVRHYRDSNGKEIDAVAVLADGRWGAIEVKLGGGQILNGVKSLCSADQIDTKTMGDPAFRLVVTGTGPILTADDGTVSAPLSALSP